MTEFPSDPTARALKLLSLLQAQRLWSGLELSERLGISPRTLRRDIDRLRELGYEVHAEPGVDGGYQLQPGGRLPPLLLDDDEAVAMAVGLRIAAVGLGEQTVLSALVKLEQMLDPHLRRRVSALQEHVIPASSRTVRVDAEAVAYLALACRDRMRVRFRYVSQVDAETSRHVEPHTLVSQEGRWYLVCWDLDRADWRTFRLDRISRLLRTGVRFEERALPTEEPAEMVIATSTDTSPAFEAVAHLELSLDDARQIFGVWATGATSNAADGTDWPVGGSYLADLVYGPAWIPEDVRWTLSGPEHVRQMVAEFGQRLVDAASAPAQQSAKETRHSEID